MLHLSGLFSVDRGQGRSREKTKALARIMREHRGLSKYDEWQGLRSSGAGSQKYQEPFGLSHTETRESGIRRAFVRLVAEKVLKAYNYVEVDACARVKFIANCSIRSGKLSTTGLRHLLTEE